MRVASISANYSISVIPTQMRYSLIKEMYEGSNHIKVCDISYEIIAGKYKKQIVSMIEGEPVDNEVQLDFASPVIFDTGSITIPYSLYLLIEQYRMNREPGLLIQINSALAEFEFENSLREFVLQVSDIQ